MCGLTAIVGPAGSDDLAAAERMAGALDHRGPDDAGSWGDRDAGVALGFRRLAIRDLSPAGHQPMTSADGRWTVVFNGEIYNEQALRRRLAGLGHRFRGTGDTEVLVEALAEWGPEGCLPLVDGMFAIAAWDGTARRLVLARDRFGEKPLLVARAGATVLVASEIGALRRHPGHRDEIDPVALAGYLRNGWVPPDRSIYAGTTPVPPGCWLEIRPGGAPGDPQRYWSAAAEVASAPRWRGSIEEATDELERLLGEVVASRLRADVPVGAFLSGGIDSSLLCAAALATSPSLRTFSARFADPSLDEGEAAADVARRLGCDHEEVHVGDAEAISGMAGLPAAFDEPFGDPAALPTLLLARAARRSLTVALAGDGADEIFGGYRQHRLVRRYGPALDLVPASARRRLARLSPHPRLAEALDLADAAALHDRLTATVADTSHLLPGVAAGAPRRPEARDPLRLSLLLDIGSYLPGCILVKTDRSLMQASVEGRLPFLSADLLRFSAGLPAPWLVHGHTNKRILRLALERRLGPSVASRPKHGFTVPVSRWLRGPLKGSLDDVVDPGSPLLDIGLRAEGLTTLVARHRSGGADHGAILWAIVALDGWLRMHHPTGARVAAPNGVTRGAQAAPKRWTT